MVGAFFLAACLLAAGDTEAAASSSSPSKSEPTPLYVLSRETSEAMRREAVAKEPAQRATAISELCELHKTLLTDERYEQVDKLKELRGRIYSRLRRVQLDLKQDLVKDGGKPERRDADALVAAQAAAERDQAALAAADSLAASLSILDASVGGPNALIGHGGRAVQDDGQELVDLIERTINPAFWDTNGGPGSIVYYQPLQCLVVRASGEVHERLGGVVGGLRAAGR